MGLDQWDRNLVLRDAVEVLTELVAAQAAIVEWLRTNRTTEVPIDPPSIIVHRSPDLVGAEEAAAAAAPSPNPFEGTQIMGPTPPSPAVTATRRRYDYFSQLDRRLAELSGKSADESHHDKLHEGALGSSLHCG